MATRVEVNHQIVPSNAHRETEMSIVDVLLFPPFIQFESPAHRMVIPTFRTGPHSLSSTLSINILWAHTKIYLTNLLGVVQSNLVNY